MHVRIMILTGMSGWHFVTRVTPSISGLSGAKVGYIPTYQLIPKFPSRTRYTQVDFVSQNKIQNSHNKQETKPLAEVAKTVCIGSCPLTWIKSRKGFTVCSFSSYHHPAALLGKAQLSIYRFDYMVRPRSNLTSTISISRRSQKKRHRTRSGYVRYVLAAQHGLCWPRNVPP